MKKIWLSVIFLIIAVVIVAGALYLIFAQVKYIDCGTDEECFKETVESCRPSKILFIINETGEDFEPQPVEIITYTIEEVEYEIEVEPKPLIISLTAEIFIHGKERARSFLTEGWGFLRCY